LFSPVERYNPRHDSPALASAGHGAGDQDLGLPDAEFWVGFPEFVADLLGAAVPQEVVVKYLGIQWIAGSQLIQDFLDPVRAWADLGVVSGDRPRLRPLTACRA